MTKRYTGGVVSSSLPTVNAAGASGVFLLSQQADYQSRNSWPPFKVEESLRFRASATGYLNKTFAAAGNRKTWTWSGWVKRGTLSTNQGLFACWIGAGSTRMWFGFITSTNQITFYGQNGGSTIFDLQTTPVYRDPSAWYHLVLAVDTTQSTSSNRAKIYVNGVQVTAFSTSTYASQNTDTAINSADAHYLGSEVTTSTVFDGYMSEVNFIDGQALTPSAFGATDKDGNWSPIAYTGTYGTNGFYVNFRDNTSATTMGYDYSGNGNNWTLNNFNVSTANTSYDIMIDVPSDQAGANTRGNYATLNPLNGANNGTLGDGNLSIDSNSGSASAQASAGTMSMKSGKYYFEYTRVQSSNDTRFGIIRDDKFISGGNVGLSASEYGYHVISTGTLSVDGTTTSSWITAFSQGDVGMIAYDADTGKVWFGRNGTWGGSGDPAAGTNPAATVNSFATYGYTAWVRVIGGGSPTIEKGAINFGQRPFAYAPPSGFKSLNTFNLPEPTIKQPNKQFDVSLWTGNGSTQSITGLNFKPDLVWVKVRSSTQNHSFNDPLRGAGNYLVPNATAAERFQGEFTSFNSDGFSLTFNAAEGDYNASTKTYVGWSWNAGGANTTNTSGSITSIVRANPTAGFSIFTYTGNGTGGATVGHGLGVAPSMVIVKRRNGVASWIVNHTSAGTGFLLLENTTGYSSATTYWTTAPTSSLLPTLTSNSEVNASGGTYVAYCFAPIAGYSAFGSYAGNSSNDGPFIFTGFRPRFVMIKRIDSTGNWIMFDSARGTYNVNGPYVYANSSTTEGTSTTIGLDFLSNGFKNINSYNDSNTSGGTYIYAAFAEAPFKYARSR